MDTVHQIAKMTSLALQENWHFSNFLEGNHPLTLGKSQLTDSRKKKALRARNAQALKLQNSTPSPYSGVCVSQNVKALPQ